MHRINAAEKYTQTFKGHFKSILCGIATDFPLKKWDTLLPQAELICNLLHQLNIAFNVLAQAYTFEPRDFNIMPLAPLGRAVKIHETKQKTNMGGPFSRWMVSRNLTRTLPML